MGDFQTSEMTGGFETTSDSSSTTHEKLAEGRQKAAEYGGVARRKLMERADQKKSELSGRLDKLADNLEDLGGEDGGPERQVAASAAKYLRQAKDLLDKRSSDELMNLAVSELKNRPSAVVAGLFAVGFLGARFLRS
jgi:hypothetical protein